MLIGFIFLWYKSGDKVECFIEFVVFTKCTEMKHVKSSIEEYD